MEIMSLLSFERQVVYPHLCSFRFRWAEMCSQQGHRFNLTVGNHPRKEINNKVSTVPGPVNEGGRTTFLDGHTLLMKTALIQSQALYFSFKNYMTIN